MTAKHQKNRATPVKSDLEDTYTVMIKVKNNFLFLLLLLSFTLAQLN